MDNNQQSASNTAQAPVQTPVTSTETPPSELNTASPPSPTTPQSPVPPLPQSSPSNVAPPRAGSNVAVRNAVNATLQSQAQSQGVDQQSPSPYSPPLPQPKPVSSQDPRLPPNQAVQGFSQKEVKPLTWRAFAKMAYIVIFIAGALGGLFFISNKTFLKPETEISGDILLQAPYQPVLWKDFGEVFEPMIKMPLYYPEGFVKHNFLLDSGALVSSLPREEAKKMGISLAKLPRSTFGGFGGTTSFAYKSEAKIKLGEEEVKIPVVFTEAGGTKSILGRSGFFEKYSIYFNSKREMIEIRK